MKEIESGYYDAVLIACFSVHTLVPHFGQNKNLAVTGIFEASILTAFSILSDPKSNEKWGVVTTGKFWEDHLSHGANHFIGQNEGDANSKFAGVVSTGLTAGDLHTAPAAEVREKLKTATKKLLDTGNVRCVVMGCGGMAGLEEIIRETAVEVYGAEEAAHVYVVDGVKAGILQLEQAVRSRRAFRSGS
jgi:Asp/Glu/hydantoin racemase